MTDNAYERCWEYNWSIYWIYEEKDTSKQFIVVQVKKNL